MQNMEDELFDTIGSFGLWQKTIYAVFFLGNLVGIWQNYAITFLAPNVPFRCVDGEALRQRNTTTTDHHRHYEVNVTDELWNNECTAYPSNDSGGVPCTKWEYDTEQYSDTLVSQWDLVCDREWLISFAKSVYMIGFMMSVFISGQVSDRIGRRPTILVNYVITCLSLILSLFSTSIEVFLVFRFLQAFGRTGFTTVGYVLMLEMVGPRDRTFVGITIQLGWCTGFVALAFVGYFFRNWFWFQVAIAVPVLPLIVVFVLVPESPRWLLMHGKTEPMKKLLVSAAKRNGKDLKEDAGDIVHRLAKTKTDERKGTLFDLFRTPRMRSRTANVMYLWLVNAFVYYALSFNTNDLFGDPYVNFLLVAVLEFPSYGLLYLSMRYFGRRSITVVLMVLGGAACLGLLAVPDDSPWMATVLSQCGKFCVTASFGLLYMYTGEMFPTVVRSAALGSCSTAARIGSIVAPFSREMGKATHPLIPNILCSLLAISSGLFALWLPETAKSRMPDTLEEGENAFEMKE